MVNGGFYWQRTAGKQSWGFQAWKNPCHLPPLVRRNYPIRQQRLMEQQERWTMLQKAMMSKRPLWNKFKTTMDKALGPNINLMNYRFMNGRKIVCFLCRTMLFPSGSATCQQRWKKHWVNGEVLNSSPDIQGNGGGILRTMYPYRKVLKITGLLSTARAIGYSCGYLTDTYDCDPGRGLSLL